MNEAKRIKLYRENPDKFIEEILGVKSLEDYQINLCRAFAKYDRIAVSACHSVGKTWTMARLSLAFLYCYPNSKVITTAPTFRQVTKLLWGEIRSAKNSAPIFLDGKLNQTELTLSDQWFSMGFSPKTSASTGSAEQKDSSFQGFHAPYIVIIFDEATGVGKDVYTMAEGLQTSGKIVKWICIANPTTRNSEFFKITRLAEWKSIKINCFDSPNLKENGFNNIEDINKEILYLKTLTDEERLERIKNYKKPNHNLINAQWVISKIYAWGLDHPLTKSKILGEFPDADDSAIINYQNIFKAFNRDLHIDKSANRFIGVDVARFGDDLTIITELRGNKLVKKIVAGKLSNTEVAGKIMDLINSCPELVECHVSIDATGVGSGVVDILNENKNKGLLDKKVFIHEVHFAQSVEEPEEKEAEKRDRKLFANLKAKLFWDLNEDLKNDLDIPHEEVYEEELSTILYKFDSKGRIQIQSKDEYKAKYGKSPDHADSLALANMGRNFKPTHGFFTPPTPTKSFFSNNNDRKDRKTNIKIKEY